MGAIPQKGSQMQQCGPFPYEGAEQCNAGMIGMDGLQLESVHLPPEIEDAIQRRDPAIMREVNEMTAKLHRPTLSERIHQFFWGKHNVVKGGK